MNRVYFCKSEHLGEYFEEMTAETIHVCALDSEYDRKFISGAFLYYDLAQIEAGLDKVYGVYKYGVRNGKGILCVYFDPLKDIYAVIIDIDLFQK